MSIAGVLHAIVTVWDRLFYALERIVLAGFAIGGGVLAWWVLGALEYGVWIQTGGALVGALVSALLAWIVWTVMKLTGG